MAAFSAALLLSACPNPANDTPTLISSNADLSALTVSTGTLVPPFAPGTTVYTVNVNNSVTSITVTGTLADTNATVSANNGKPQNLQEGNNVIPLTVTAQDGTTKKDYVVTVIRSQDYSSSKIGTLKYVPAGRFQRDATETNISVVSAFRMSQHEITRSQFQTIMGTDPSEISTSSGTSDPVQNVNWYHAIAFCNKLSLAEGLTPVYRVTVGGSEVNWSTLTYANIPISSNADWDGATADWNANGYRLPTEMEWMWAAMGAPEDGQGGGTNTTGYTKAFAGSTGINAIGDYAWYVNNSDGKTHPAGTKLPNELELYDMSGNVLEWCWDWYDTYPTGSIEDYRGPASGSDRIFRGGSWGDGEDYCIASWQGCNFPYSSSHVDGFRVVRR